MASLKAIKKRITSVKSTQKITRAMKLVSAAKLRRAQEKAQASRPYESELLGMVGSILNEVEWASPLVKDRGSKRAAIVVVSTDRGLCGSLNANTFKLVSRRLEELGGESVEIVALGKRGSDFFRKRGYKIHSVYADLLKEDSFERVSGIARNLTKLFLEGSFDRVEVFYPQFCSAISQVATRVAWLPFVPVKGGNERTTLYEPLPAQLLESLVPMLIEFQFYRMILESNASEHGARMAAMEAATKNSKEMIERLTLERNRARQAAITKELMEIIGGAEALAG